MATHTAIALLLLYGSFLPQHAVPVDTLFREEFSVGAFQNATRFAVDARGWMYVVDADRNQVFLFRTRSDSAPHSVVGGYGWNPAAFDLPTGLAADGLNLYVSDYNNHRIQRFDRNLNYLSLFSTRDTSFTPARFGFPSGVALSRLGEIFVVDGENLRVVKFSPQGAYRSTFGGIEDRRGRLRQPLKIAIARNDRVYVLEPDRVVEFDYIGSFLRTLGEGVVDGARGFAVDNGRLVVVTGNSLVWIALESGNVHVFPVQRLFVSPAGELRDVALDGNRLYILTANRLIAFAVEGAEGR